MEKKILLWVISLSLLALALAIFLPGGRAPDRDPKLPWDIRLDALGGSEVFGLRLGSSTLDEARTIFGDRGKVSLFTGSDEKLALEAYFERIFLSGLRADFILVLEADQETLKAIHDRGSRISRTTTTTHKVELGSEDLESTPGLPIRLINYIPAANLDEELLLKRFGEPEERISEAESPVVHWTYPESGLSIGVNPQGRELFQYIRPDRFDELLEVIREGKQPSGE
jgi:hypothetical protein